MRKVMCILTIACLTASIFSGCSDSKGNVMDGDGMMYEFTAYELDGDWTEVGTDNPATLRFSDDSLYVSEDGDEEIHLTFSLSEDDSIKTRTLHIKEEGAPFEVLLFRMISVNGWNVNCLFEVEGDGNASRVFVRNIDRSYLPTGYIPSPNDGIDYEPEPSEGLPDQDALNAEFLEDILLGEWTEVGSDSPWTVTFGKKSVTWTDEKGTGETHDYSLSLGFNNRMRYIYLSGSLRDFMEFIYTGKVIDGNKVRVMFAADEPTGTTEKDIIKAFVKNEDLDLIPEGYSVDYYTDNDVEYKAPDLKEVYFVEEGMDIAGWLGKTHEEAGISEEYVENGSISFSGYIMGYKMTGRAYERDGGIADVSVYSYDADLDEMNLKLTEEYGEPETFDNPYVAGEGATMGWTYSGDGYTLSISAYSELPYISISFRKN